MAEYKSIHTGVDIDEAVTQFLKQNFTLNNKF